MFYDFLFVLALLSVLAFVLCFVYYIVTPGK